MSHLNFQIFAFSTNFCPFKNINITRFARNIECDFFVIFKHREKSAVKPGNALLGSPFV